MRKRSGRPPRFAQVPNETVDDSPNLDLTALGLLTVFLRHKDGWDITLADVAKKYGHGEDAMANAMGALQIARYVVKVRVMGAGNQWRTEMAVYAPPATDAELDQLLADIRAEDSAVKRVEVIEPTATATKRAQARRDKLAKKNAAGAAKKAVHQGPPTPEIPRVGEQDAPDSGVSRVPGNPRVSKNTVVNQEEDEKDRAVADAVGHGAGGFARAASRSAAAEETGEAEGGCAASEPTLPSQRRTSPRPAATRTRPRQTAPGFDMVRDAVPAAVARPGTKLFVGLHRAINDLLLGSPGIPRRTPEQVIARINRRWYGENAEERSAADYRGCDRCTASGCSAPRRSEDEPDGCDRIKNRNSWLAAAILAQDCPDPGCEDGWVIGGGECRACRERHEERREAARVAAEAAARWKTNTEVYGAALAALDAWTTSETAEENRLRQTLAETGLYGQMLDHHVQRHMTGWRDRNPAPANPKRQAATA